MSEWSNEHDWKSCDVNSVHGFKSHSLRQLKLPFDFLSAILEGFFIIFIVMLDISKQLDCFYLDRLLSFYDIMFLNQGGVLYVRI